MKEIIVGRNEEGQRLDKLAVKFLPCAGRGFLYKMMRKKNITLNDKKCEGNEILSAGDSVKFWLADDTILKFSDSKKQTSFYPDPDIVYEDGDIIAINKPAGILSQKAEPSDVSVNEILISYLMKKGELTEEQLMTFRPSICNRLDRNTSGLIICGKSLKGLQQMAQMLKERTAHKDYIAFVRGEVREGKSLKGYLSKDRSANLVSVGDTGDYIETEFKPLWTDGRKSVIMVRLITGKTHQIRAHLAAAGHPILGDRKYGDGKGAGRQMLHAFCMTLPDGRTFTAPLPEDMKWEHGKPGDFGDLPWRI